jgi:hypothetical protein
VKTLDYVVAAIVAIVVVYIIMVLWLVTPSWQ